MAIQTTLFDRHMIRINGINFSRLLRGMLSAKCSNTFILRLNVLNVMYERGNRVLEPLLRRGALLLR